MSTYVLVVLVCTGFWLFFFVRGLLSAVAGLVRLGYLLAHEAIIDGIFRIKIPYNLSISASAAGVAALSAPYAYWNPKLFCFVKHCLHDLLNNQRYCVRNVKNNRMHFVHGVKLQSLAYSARCKEQSDAACAW